MAWISNDIAVLSLGMSCQTARQIQAVGRSVLGAGVKASGYFDWLIAPPSAAATLLEAGLPGIADPSDIRQHPDGMPACARSGALYWHDFRAPGGHDVPAMFESAAARRRFVVERFRALMDGRRVLFVWSNTQNNLSTFCPRYGLDHRLTQSGAERLIAAADAFAGRPCEYLFVSYPDRRDAFAAPPRVSVVELAPDTSEWTGDEAQWRAALARAISPD